MARVKYLFILLFIKSILQFTYGQPQTKHFRDDYKYLEDTSGFYKIHTIQKSWENAKRRCALEDASLFYPEDQNEADVVLAYMKETQPSFAWVYVGISSKLSKGVFKTIDGVAIRNIYNKWGAGEPNDANGEEDCVILRRDSTYNDEKCSKKFPFICKKTLQSLKWNEECNTPYLGDMTCEKDKTLLQILCLLLAILVL